jgi:hypothetical protein
MNFVLKYAISYGWQHWSEIPKTRIQKMLSRHRVAGSAINSNIVSVIPSQGEMASFSTGMTPFLLEIERARGM